MSENKDKLCLGSSVCSATSNSPMGNKCRYMFNRLSSFVTSLKKSSKPRGQRIFHRDVEKEEFQSDMKNK